MTWADQKKAKYLAIGWTIVYAILLLPLSNIAFLAFYFSRGSDPLGILVAALGICIPLSLIASITLTWIFYSRKKYGKSIYFGIFPYAIIILALLVYSIIELVHIGNALWS